jgi:hypothetical protein
MAYPRRCPRCGTDYTATRGPDLCHVTVRAEPGGTPSPWRRGLPGRLLTLACLACNGEYAWDYFAGAAPAGDGAAPGRRPLRGTAAVVRRALTLPGSRPRPR